MKSSSTKFLITVLIVTLLCAVLQIVWNNQAPEKFRLQTGFVLLAFFSLSISAIHLFLLHSAKGEPQGFIRKYMASTVFKFMFYLLFLIVLLLFSSDNKTTLILHFLVYYSAFTVLEVSFLYGELRKSKK